MVCTVYKKITIRGQFKSFLSTRSAHRLRKPVPAHVRDEITKVVPHFDAIYRNIPPAGQADRARNQPFSPGGGEVGYNLSYQYQSSMRHSLHSISNTSRRKIHFPDGAATLATALAPKPAKAKRHSTSQGVHR